MKTSLMMLGLLLFLGANDSAQVRLGVPDARTLLWSIPEMDSARKEGRCPSLQVEAISDNEVHFVGRVLCTPDGSGLMGRFQVNRYTGRVSLAGSRESLPASQTAAALAEALRRRRSDQQLSGGDAVCLAAHLKIAERALGLPFCPAVRLISTEASVARIAISFGCRPDDKVHLTPLLVDLDLQTGLATYETTGAILEYADPQLRGHAVVAREAPQLTTVEAGIVAEAVLGASSHSGDECAQADVEPDIGDGTSVGLEIASGCNSRRALRELWLLSLQTGEIREAATGRPLESSKVRIVAAHLLEEARGRQQRGAADMASSCSSPDR